MLEFSSFVSIIICSRNEGGISRWVDIFGRELENFSSAEGVGGWVGEKVVETERNVTITKWGAGEDDIRKIIRLGQVYQAAEEQEAVSVVCQHPLIGWKAYIVYTQEDWAELERCLAQVFAVPV